MMKKMFTLLSVIAISITTNAALTGFSMISVLPSWIALILR